MKLIDLLNYIPDECEIGIVDGGFPFLMGINGMLLRK